MAPLGSLLKQASFEQYERVARDNDTPTDFPCSFVEFSDDTSWCIERWPGWHFRRTSARNFKVGDFNQVYICNNEGHAEGSAILMTLVNIHRIQTSEFHWKQQCLTTCRAGRSRSLTEALCTGQSRKTKHAQAWQPEKPTCILDTVPNTLKRSCLCNDFGTVSTANTLPLASCSSTYETSTYTVTQKNVVSWLIGFFQPVLKHWKLLGSKRKSEMKVTAGILHRQPTDQVGEVSVWACVFEPEIWCPMLAKGKVRGNPDGGS